MKKLPVADDQALIQLIKTGDYRAFREFYDQHWKRMYALAYRMLNNPEACADILQEVFVEIWSKRASLSINNVSAYLNQCIRFKIFNTYKYERIRQQFEAHEQGEPVQNTVSETVAYNELSGLIATSVNRLPAQCKKVFLLKNDENLSNKEIASQLNLSIKTVEKHVTIAMQKLRLSLREFLT